VRKDGHFEVIEKRFDADKEIGAQLFEGQIENFQQASSH
jgi:hypothetical protein